MQDEVKKTDVVSNEHEDINKEIEAELLAYLENGEEEQKEEKKKYKSALFITMLIMLILYLVRLSNKIFFIYAGLFLLR
ncbi:MULTISPECIES: hypothetical protein [unclassified Staphylococcus]|uniref:hypothetical protein n=1 Tax=unclassified Staphylococcus TaxID=91994 RepID=UPI0021CDFEF9|nr:MULTISPECIES: hypothetical protein [unclassified Staphylococcus]UXR69529.1 hypothetical protein MUA26_10495 [Staphylococcus sp. IVB6246]UXR71584.1 hypothetical protein MUA88_10500 [Staphylococcus sp. IVB6240]UXR73860.1 hypothetical protein MUA48_11010 [Staphylococcus sp. IVB6238]UXR76181.1 hypothetical protein MUA74_11110 [Staphylococcus sp. IVB6233]UXR80378.1 hypothetical protein MUA65_10715 [Staphylococcus sp. IVB6218]